jgi:hypothetical protein
MIPDSQQPLVTSSPAKVDSAPSGSSATLPNLAAGQNSVQRQAASDLDIPNVASDSDLIEKEWVAIMKRIILENKDDPYRLSRAITLLRADYMKKRYGKDIKLAE